MNSATCAEKLNAPVISVILVFLIIYFTAVFGEIVPRLSFSVPGVVQLGLFTTLTLLALFSYFCCVFVGPGGVPVDWIPDTESLSQVFEIKRKGQTAARYCQKCKRHKPPRAHHCRVCNTCVLRMDHHCAWINNCVGHSNYKSFVLFLIYTVSALFHAVLILSGFIGLSYSSDHANDDISNPQANRSIRNRGDTAVSGIFWILCSALWKVMLLTVTSILMVALAMLLGWHIYLIRNNKSTIEYHEGVRARGMGSLNTQHPYELGLCGNLHAVLGTNPAMWPFPCDAGAAGDGLEYEMGAHVASVFSQHGTRLDHHLQLHSPVRERGGAPNPLSLDQ